MILVANNLIKKFGSHYAINGLSLTVNKGEFYSLLGPNGAGKSTLVHLLSTLLQPDEGTIRIDDKTSGKDNNGIKSVLGIVPQEISLYDDLTALENLKFWGRMYRVEKSLLDKRIQTLLTQFGLSDRQNDKVKNYSGGMKRRINIAAAILHQPKIVFMDEPTVGIDPQSRNNIYDVLLQMKKEGITILYTTHYMEEAEKFSDRVGIIDAGKIIAEGTVMELTRLTKTREEIRITTENIQENQIYQLKEKFHGNIIVDNNYIVIETDDVKKDLIPVLNYCSSLQLEIEQVEIQKANLEKVFLSLTGKTLRD